MALNDIFSGMQNLCIEAVDVENLIDLSSNTLDKMELEAFKFILNYNKSHSPLVLNDQVCCYFKLLWKNNIIIECWKYQRKKFYVLENLHYFMNKIDLIKSEGKYITTYFK